jgi:hypothetical protein
MIEQSPLCPERVRKRTGSFACLAPRFVRDGFWAMRSPQALLLYLFLVLVADRHGLSSDSFDKRCPLLQLSLDDDLAALRPATPSSSRPALPGMATSCRSSLYQSPRCGSRTPCSTVPHRWRKPTRRRFGG